MCPRYVLASSPGRPRPMYQSSLLHLYSNSFPVPLCPVLFFCSWSRRSLTTGTFSISAVFMLLAKYKLDTRLTPLLLLALRKHLYLRLASAVMPRECHGTFRAIGLALRKVALCERLADLFAGWFAALAVRIGETSPSCSLVPNWSLDCRATSQGTSQGI